MDQPALIDVLRQKMDTAERQTWEYLRKEHWTEPGGLFYARPHWYEVRRVWKHLAWRWRGSPWLPLAARDR